MYRLPAAHSALRAALLVASMVAATARPACAQRPQPADSAAILLRLGVDARRDGLAESLRGAIALWTRAEDVARRTRNRRSPWQIT